MVAKRTYAFTLFNSDFDVTDNTICLVRIEFVMHSYGNFVIKFIHSIISLTTI